MDQITEIIAHFGGMFHLNIEELRLRNQYDLFKAEKAAESEVEVASFTGVKVANDYDLRGFDPKLKTAAVPEPLPQNSVAAGSLIADSGVSPGLGVAPFILPMDIPVGSSIANGAAKYLPYVPIPSSIATVTIQHITLFDNDVVGDGATADFLTTVVLLDHLVAVGELASQLDAFGSEFQEINALDTDEWVQVVKDQIDTFEAPPIFGVQAFTFDQEAIASATVDGMTVHLSGNAMAEAPELETLAPAFLRDETEEAVESGAAEDRAEDDSPAKDPFKSTGYDPNANPFKLEPGHMVVAGANEMVNAVGVTTSWIDAGVIMVGGNVTKATSVSQVNVLGDRDNLSVPDASAPSKALNIAEFSVQSDKLSEKDGGETASNAAPVLPTTWHLETIEGDVIAYNSIEQYSFNMDADRIEFNISAWNTYLGTGENLLFNGANTIQAGFGYDLIFVGGNMTSVTTVSQKNVLLDDDTVELAEGNPGVISGGDNLLVNNLSVEQHGIDSFAEVTSQFSEAMKQLKAGATEISEAVAHDALFTGIEALRALYITGSLTKITEVYQTNVLGDQDQVKLALDNYLSKASDAIEVITGSNRLVNTAQIKDLGFDSTIMAQGEIYDDLLLYQAELIDTDAAPLGVALSELASEAVAFLADGMLLPEKSGTDHGVYGALDLQDSVHVVDVMQTMTA